MSTDSAGAVLFAMYISRQHVGSSRVLFEGVEAARHLRQVMSPSVPLLLYANALAMARLPLAQSDSKLSSAPWDERHEVTFDRRVRAHLSVLPSARRRQVLLRAAPYLFKLSALLLVRADRVLFLDCDVLVIQPSFVHAMLGNVLRVADVAMPLDPGREPRLTDGKPPWAIQSAGPPPLCSAVLAYRKTNATDALWHGAARRLALSMHPEARQGDQEMIW